MLCIAMHAVPWKGRCSWKALWQSLLDSLSPQTYHPSMIQCHMFLAVGYENNTCSSECDVCIDLHISKFLTGQLVRLA